MHPRNRHRSKSDGVATAMFRVLDALDGYHNGRVARDTVSMAIRVASSVGCSDASLIESCGITQGRIDEAKRKVQTRGLGNAS